MCTSFGLYLKNKGTIIFLPSMHMQTPTHQPFFKETFTLVKFERQEKYLKGHCEEYFVAQDVVTQGNILVYWILNDLVHARSWLPLLVKSR